MSARAIAATGAVLGALAVGAGAFGAHALQGRLDPTAMAWFDTAARYQLVHAAALLALAALDAHAPRLRLAAILIAAGVVVFSGTLYAMALGAPRWLGAVTPLGGVSLVAGWLAAAAAALRPR